MPIEPASMEASSVRISPKRFSVAITFEYYHADISGLGLANRLHVGDNNWTLGLLLEF